MSSFFTLSNYGVKRFPLNKISILYSKKFWNIYARLLKRKVCLRSFTLKNIYVNERS